LEFIKHRKAWNDNVRKTKTYVVL